MKQANPVQMERARQVLAHEAAAGSEHERATTAVRVYDKLRAQLAPIVGESGVQLLFMRSAKLVQGDFASVAQGEDSTKLRERLQTRKPVLPAESAEALFGMFFTLVTSFIGERLTTQVLRGAWPTFKETAPEKTK